MTFMGRFYDLTCFRSHSGVNAEIVAAFLTLPTVLHRNLAVAALLADELWVPRFLVGPPEEGSTAEAGNSAVVNLVWLLTHFPANGADEAVLFFTHSFKYVLGTLNIHFKITFFVSQKFFVIFFIASKLPTTGYVMMFFTTLD